MIDKVEKNKYSIDKEELRQYLIDNSDEVNVILEFFGFHYIKKNNNNQIRCALPDRDNPNSVAIDLNTLYCNIFVSPSYQGDLFGMIKHFNDNFGKKYQWNFTKVLNVIGGILHIRDSKKMIKIKEYNKTTDIHKISKQSVEKERNKQNVEYDLSCLNDYIRLPHIKFIREGILPFVQEKYCICYDDKGKRIVIPHFKFNDKTKIIGLKARTTIENYELLDIDKYINYIKGYEKSKNIYALSHNIDAIKTEQKIILFEAEKSVMKYESFNLFPCISVALGGSSLSDWQGNYIGQLAKEIGDFEVIIALDKDVENEHIINMGKKLKEYGCNKISFILDKDDMLGEKDSPIDKGLSIWQKLYFGRERFG